MEKSAQPDPREKPPLDLAVDNASQKEQIELRDRLIKKLEFELRIARMRADHAETALEDKSRVKDEAKIKSLEQKNEELQKRDTDRLREIRELESKLDESRSNESKWKAENDYLKRTRRGGEIVEANTQSVSTPPLSTHHRPLPYNADSRDNRSTAPNFTESIKTEKKEEPTDCAVTLNDTQISAQNVVGDGMEVGDGEMQNNQVMPAPLPGGSLIQSPHLSHTHSLGDLSTVSNASLIPASLANDGPINVSQLIPSDDQIFGMVDVAVPLENRSDDLPFDENTFDHTAISGMDDTSQPMENALNDLPSDESMIEPAHRTMSHSDADETAQSETKNDLLGEEGEKIMAVDHSADAPKDLNEAVEGKKRGRPSRIVSRDMKYYDSGNDSEGETEPSVKKPRSESARRSGIKKRSSGNATSQSTSVKERRISKQSDTEMNCPECEYRTTSVIGWVRHLSRIHSTTPTLAGFIIRCECGHESTSGEHSYKCDTANFTVIRKGNGPIRRVDDEKTTPQCVLCEVYPSTVGGYLKHLQREHKSTLKENDIVLNCSCGLECASDNFNRKHSKECDGRDFTLHKLDEE